MGQALGNALAFCRPRPHDHEPCYDLAHTSISTPPAAAGDSTNNATTAMAASGAGVSGSFVHQRQPRVAEDAEQQECYGCSVAFDVLVRRHHCRRCCNIYCQRCSSQSDRLLLFGQPKAVRLCDGCAREAAAEAFGLLLVAARAPRRRPVHLRVTRDLSTLEELDDEEEEAGVSRGGGIAEGGPADRKSRRGTARRHLLAEVESVEPAPERSAWDVTGWLGKAEEGPAAAGAAAALVIRLRGNEQARSAAERDRWVSALGEAVRRLRAPCLEHEVEEERLRRREEADTAARRLRNARKRQENEGFRARMAEKYGLDIEKYTSSSRSGGGGGAGGIDGGGGASAIAGRIRPSAPQQLQQRQKSRPAGSDGGRRGFVGIEGGGGDGGGGGVGRVIGEVARFQALAGLVQ
ncbi:unnamed protein product [Ectocarpus sp. CCAP 1310/34]|nr:unnamed protein product [Ectocarpus sp. CCAP 1310/34]